MAKISTVTVEGILYKLVGSGGDDPIVEGTLTDLQTFTGDDGTIWNAQSPNIDDTYFVDTTKNILYRWSGTQFTALGSGLALGETENTAYAGNKGKTNADNIADLQTDVDHIITTDIVNLDQDKVDKIKQQYQLYGTDRNSQQVAIQYNIEPLGNDIPERTSDGRLKGTTATEDNDLPNFLQVKNLLKTAMPNRNYKGNIEENAFYQWCLNTPDVVDGALFSVEIQSTMPSGVVNRGFPIFEIGTILYGFFHKGQSESPIVIITEKGNFKIINGTSELYCYPIGGTEVVANNGQPATTPLETIRVGKNNYKIPSASSVYFEESSSTLEGTWQFKLEPDSQLMPTNVSFESNGKSFSRMELKYIAQSGHYGLTYDSIEVCDGRRWIAQGYSVINITDASNVSNIEEFETWLNKWATKQ